jgi:phosphoribosylglycinamide formyltransferase-1
MKKLRIGVLVSGRGSNLQAIIDAIEEGKLSASVVVVISDTPGVFALERAQKHGIPTLVVERGQYTSREAFEKALAAALEQHEVHVVALAGFMRLLSRQLIARYPQRIVNIHPALLPSFPGLHAQAQALAYGAKVSGCTVHFVDEGMDTGPVIVQEAVEVWENDTEESLSARILAAEHRSYPKALQLIAEGRVRVEGRTVRIMPYTLEEGSDGP